MEAIIITSLLQAKKPRHGGVKLVSQGDAVGNWPQQDRNPIDVLDPHERCECGIQVALSKCSFG